MRSKWSYGGVWAAKGADHQMVHDLDRGMRRYGDLLRDDLGKYVAETPGQERQAGWAPG
jgi:glycerate kinase